jgi:4-diphosphocytidyl-2-C-methyl-D-erythritol kinase
MNTIFDLSVPGEELIELSKEIGSDVPFFMKGGAAYARGRGDELKFFKLPAMSLVLYYPGYPISTQWAYDEYDKEILTPQAETCTISEEPKKKKKKGLSFEMKNDFERVVFKKHPDLLDVKTNLIASGAYFVSLSGSGSCLFTIIDESVRNKVTKYLDGIGAQYYEVRTL